MSSNVGPLICGIRMGVVAIMGMAAAAVAPPPVAAEPLPAAAVGGTRPLNIITLPNMGCAGARIAPPKPKIVISFSI